MESDKRHTTQHNEERRVANERSGMAACPAGVCDDLTSGALLCHYRLTRQSCYMFLLLPFLPHWIANALVTNLTIHIYPAIICAGTNYSYKLWLDVELMNGCTYFTYNFTNYSGDVVFIFSWWSNSVLKSCLFWIDFGFIKNLSLVDINENLIFCLQSSD